MRFYHATSESAAAAILACGFRDATDYYLTDRLFTGVWFSEVPATSGDGARSDEVLLEVDLPISNDQLADFEWVEEGKWFREWLFPAALVNEHGRIRVVTSNERDAIEEGAISRPSSRSRRAARWT